MPLNENVPSHYRTAEKLSELGGSDLITTGSPPQVRLTVISVRGDVSCPDFSGHKTTRYSVLTDAQKHRFEENLELDFSFGVKAFSLSCESIQSTWGCGRCVSCDSLRSKPLRILVYRQ